MEPLRIDPGTTIPAEELSWRAARASGPGGQNVNKVATKVELRFDLARDTALPEPAKSRLRAAQSHRLDAEGALIVGSQATRSQSRNLQDAREKLAALVRASLRAPKTRRPTKRTRGSERRRLEEKRRQSEKKHRRRERFD